MAHIQHAVKIREAAHTMLSTTRFGIAKDLALQISAVLQ